MKVFDYVGVGEVEKKTQAEFEAWVKALPSKIGGFERKGNMVVDQHGNMIHVWKKISKTPEADVQDALKSFGEE